jgi:hypothetical protein
MTRPASPRKRTSGSAAQKATRRTGSQQPAKASADRDGRARNHVSPLQIAQSAIEALTAITGREPDTTSALERTDEGWLVRVEVVELPRIPDSTSVMATYEVEVTSDGELVSYRRVGRYYRNQAGD